MVSVFPSTARFPLTFSRWAELLVINSILWRDLTGAATGLLQGKICVESRWYEEL
jgi:hypothetical protein